MKQVLNTFIALIVVLPFAGCYTQLATVERNDREYAYDSDTTAGENGSTVINNNYYLDDSYRQSRMRVSFNYYYPSYSSWISSYYHSYFDDYYWGMSFRPSWYYDPFYSYYPSYGGCMYPSPYYDPWYPYYSPIAYYPTYYPPIYGSGVGNPNRPRDGGATRDPQNDVRSLPIPGPTNTPVATTGGPVNRPRIADDIVPAERPGRSPERPWWEKVEDRTSRPTGEVRPIEVPKGNRPTRDGSSPTYTPSNDRPGRNPEERPIEQSKPRRPSYTPGTSERQPETRPAERPKRNEVQYTPPVKSAVPQDDTRPAQRSRETSRPSYTPAPQSAPPQSSSPRNSGGSSGGGGRRRE